MLPLDAERIWGLIERAKLAVPGSSHVRVRTLLETGWRGVVSSEGTLAARPLTRVSLALTIPVLAKGGRIVPVLLACATSGSRDLVGDVLGKLEGSLPLLDRLCSALPVQPTRCPVVLSPACAGYFIHETFGHLCEADRVPPRHREGLPLGHSVGPPDLDIWDRGDLADASGSLPFDDEGVPCRPVVLVDGGRWVGLLHSRATAGAFHVPPTGNARVTSFRFAPLCRMRVTELRPGRHESDDLFAGVADGIYIDFPYGGHVRSARFHLTAMDVRRIHAGKLVEPFAGAVLIGEPLAMLRDIDAIGQDQQLIDGLGTCSREDQRDLPVSMLAPSIRLREACVVPL
ncbi:TldD/PmbA family protein [uncultured Lamprocystis sp.]|uniref:TldD/PmbA family protein n=1 Tax=uncultured Lamprocystis sp. TaxID=543132 RepID=UPI00343BA089